MAVSAAIRRDSAPAALVQLRSTYISALETAGLVPVVTPPLRDDAAAGVLLRKVDGLVLTGGADVDPVLYGAEPHPALGRTSAERDRWEMALVRAAAQLRLPVLAICRGMQVLNVARGGSLIQDLPSEHPHGGINHDPDSPRSTRSHRMSVVSGSRLASALGALHLGINSVHHQGVDGVGEGLRIVATAPDGVVEGLESAPDSGWWCVGVQWHPEDLTGSEQEWDRSLFAAFAAAVRGARTAQGDGRAATRMLGATG